MTEHTPGPWETEYRVIFKEGHGTIASCWTKHSHSFYGQMIDEDEAYANARLMAAAPQLLEALEASLTLLNRLQACNRDFDEEIKKVCQQARAAIEAARGK